MKAKITPDEVKHIGELANLKIATKDLEKYASDLSEVISYVSRVQKADVKGVLPTNQVTGLSNVFREDVVDSSRMLTQSAALSNAKRKHDGYFVIDSIF
ncbi:Asp-tRNA(Asn)/Glu-tRNA(Gln) amidotransferase subunit GatC [Candidatus Microgenomates bacterium]|nr:Asp-tRNA(Asn)/Glu-tRNA(Gln) amidotransferase subunit GatC [Candidatus Microgenomates bacterium]